MMERVKSHAPIRGGNWCDSAGVVLRLGGFLAFTFWMRVGTVGAEPAKGIRWVGWSEKIFEQAKRENRFVLLDLGAGWCHWCHVMEEITYQDPEVIRLIGERYLAVHVDQDSRPDLANRYE